ncbi:histidine kinase [Kineosporia rhizophila]|uniref:sensor histidine kinase n=1 Tax=Kineosporia rhizophila TaxID=84633 RepID=UPI001E5400A2|nr:histidine kinase [Kineosporia rhizophila]
MTALLRSIWNAPRPPGARAPHRFDAALVFAAALVTLLEGVLRPDLPNRVLSVVTTLALTPLLYWRRAYPMHTVAIAFTVLTVVPIAAGGREPDMGALAAMLLLIYALLRWGSGREAVIGLAFVAVKLLLWQVYDPAGATEWVELLGGAGVLTTLGAVALAVRYRAGTYERELERVKLLEREQLARDLHDVVAHHVSAMVIRAQAGLAQAAVTGDQQPAVQALGVIEAEASKVLTEMRTMVRMLRRDEEAELLPSPGVADIAQLAGPGEGPAVEVKIIGDVGEVPPGVGSAVYRLAQEAVTNARRHARGATRIEVLVEGDPEHLRLSVTDDGEPVAAVRPALSPGYGLIGMAERAHLLGGTCAAGPGDVRGWVVTALLPRAGWSV